MVSFVDRNGKIFFECHEAEARSAIEIIKEIREERIPVNPEVKKMYEKIPSLMKVPATKIETKHISNVNNITDAFVEIEKTGESVATV